MRDAARLGKPHGAGFYTGILVTYRGQQYVLSNERLVVCWPDAAPDDVARNAPDYVSPAHHNQRLGRAPATCEFCDKPPIAYGHVDGVGRWVYADHRSSPTMTAEPGRDWETMKGAQTRLVEALEANDLPRALLHYTALGQALAGDAYIALPLFPRADAPDLVESIRAVLETLDGASPLAGFLRAIGRKMNEC